MLSRRLSLAERRLLDCVVSGRPLDRKLGPAISVRAGIIRALLIGKLASGCADPLGVQLEGVTIEGDLDLRQIRAEFPLQLERCTITGHVDLTDARIPRLVMARSTLMPAVRFVGSDGHDIALRLERACIGGQLDLTGMRISNAEGPALVADGLIVDQNAILGGEFAGASEVGAVRLVGAHVSGQLDLAGARVSNSTGPALLADGLIVDQEIFMGGEFTGAGDVGAVRLVGAHVSGQLDLAGARVNNPTGPALLADRLVVDQNARLGGEFVGSGEVGAVRLLGARIGGPFSMAKARISNDAGPALLADRLSVEGTAQLGGEFTGNGEKGAVRLRGAHLTGSLQLSDVRISNTAGPALLAEGLVVDQDIELAGEFTGNGEDGVVRLRSARVGGQLAFKGATHSNSGAVGGFTGLNLLGAQMGKLSLAPAQFSEANRVILDGATYRGRPGADEVPPEAWCAMLRTATPKYAAQPYQKLAGVYLAEGHLGDQRTVLIAQQEDRRIRIIAHQARQQKGRTKWVLRLRSAGLVINRVVIGYGYRPVRAAWWLLGILVAAILLTTLAAHTHDSTGSPAAVRPATLGGHPTSCSEGEQLGLATRIAIPVLSNVTQGGCQLSTARTPGEWYALAGLLLLGLAWATATLTVIGYTNLIRRT